MSEDINELQNRYLEFIGEREWEEFHTPKNLAMAISVEASELVELYQWHDNVSVDRILDDDDLRERSREELADVMIYCLSMANELNIDVEDAIADKLTQNETRFDPDTATAIARDLRHWQR
ncbi:nucleotide pyrophosphohydrolase [Natronorubrum thiooxidans]|uniref:NTP pyrophosphatase, house-cleaning of non-canonical NTPs n=1 Tax=Natronorubrum thiooxidans TaxID=308853 RepID=A0A1N7GUN1_9EURY|nr:nucleotide pyrophosphohydrolase [Natronorubrum thiooxidans]SIS16250.1 NTP pyrophosphatase, house-cleaning of non-canonical NTPs [Natronorubrum thiooxidans]